MSGPHVALPLLRDARIVLDEEPLHGPLAGICYGLEAAATDVAFVAGCDHPFVGPEVASLLVERAAGGNGAIVVADGVPQPLLAAYRKDVAAVIRQMLASGERRAMALRPLTRLVEVAAHELGDVDPAGLALIDVDTPEAYAEALEIARRQGGELSVLHTSRPPR